jgi:hypothetical protein
MQILEQSISFSKKLAYTFFQSKRAVYIFGLVVALVWLIIWLVDGDFGRIWWRRRLISWGMRLVLAVFFLVTTYTIWRFIKIFLRNEEQLFGAFKKGMILTNSVDAYTIEPNIKNSEWNFQLSFNDYDLEFDAKWIFKIGEFAYITQPARLIKRVGREEPKVHFMQVGVGEMVTYLYKIDGDNILYDSFGNNLFEKNNQKNMNSIPLEKMVIAESAQKYLKEIVKTPVQILYSPQNPQINYVLVDINGEATTPEIFLENKHNLLIWFIFVLVIVAYLLPIYLVFHSFVFDTEFYTGIEKG